MEHPVTLVEFREMYPTEEACREALFQHRWKEGFRCPRCGHPVAWYLEGRGLYECTACGHQASVTAGTLLHKSRTDPGQVVSRHLDALHHEEAPVCGRALPSARRDHKDRPAHPTQAEPRHAPGGARAPSAGSGGADESLIGGREQGKATRGRGSQRKSLVAVSAETDLEGSLGRARLEIIPDARTTTLMALAEDTILPGSTVITDGCQLQALGARSCSTA